MINDEPESGWKQHFPTYSFKERDIVLEEYRTAAKSLESEERVFLNASNIAVIAGAGLGSLAVSALEPLTRGLSAVMKPEIALLVLLFLTTAFAYVTVRYFADRQRAVVFAARKVIVLRRMLGLSYGPLQLVLPNWRLEGADEPLAVRMFPGWNTYVAYPLYLIAGISGFVILYMLSALAATGKSLWPSYLSSAKAICSLVALWVALLASGYRKALLDTHERTLLLVAQQLSRILGLRLVRNVEYVIYRAALARYEVARLGVDLANLKRALLFIEDRTFYKHRGFSVRASARALLGLAGLKRRSGGSTITQQLVRTLFIEQPTKLVRRKLVEIILALWLDGVVAKEQQLEIYLASVRFDRGVYGILAAMKHFFGKIIEAPSKAEAFFIIERVSNTQSRLLVDKIRQTALAALEAGVLLREDARAIVAIYEQAVQKGLIRTPVVGDELQRLGDHLAGDNEGASTAGG